MKTNIVIKGLKKKLIEYDDNLAKLTDSGHYYFVDKAYHDKMCKYLEGVHFKTEETIYPGESLKQKFLEEHNGISFRTSINGDSTDENKEDALKLQRNIFKQITDAGYYVFEYQHIQADLLVFLIHFSTMEFEIEDDIEVTLDDLFALKELLLEKHKGMRINIEIKK